MKETDIKQAIIHSKYFIAKVRSIAIEKYADPLKGGTRGNASSLGSQGIPLRE